MPQSKQTLRILVNLPNLSSYQDTYYMFLTMLPNIDVLYIMTTAEQATLHVKPNEKFALHNDQIPSSILKSTYSRRSSVKQVYIIPISRRSYAHHASRYLLKHIDALNLHVIHDMFGHFARFCQLYFKRSRQFVMLTTLRTTNFGWFQRVKPLKFTINSHYAGQRILSLWRDDRITRHVDKVVVLGPGHEDDVIQGYQVPAKHITFVPSETDVSLFHPNPKDIGSSHINQYTQSTERYTYHTNTTTSLNLRYRTPMHCVYTGALTRNKGLHLLLLAFTQVAKKYPQLTLQLIGRHTPFEKVWMTQAIAKHPLKHRITLTSVLDRLALIPIYQTAHLYLFPSLFEGSPRSLREAIACGCVAIASDIAGCRGIDPQGNFIHFAQMNHLSSLVNTWVKALQEDSLNYRQRQIRGIQHIQQHHSTYAVGQSYLQLYQELLDHHKK